LHAPFAPRVVTAQWQTDAAAWRRPEQVIAHWADADSVDPSLLATRVRGDWWDLLREHAITLMVTREYEHIVAAAGIHEDRPRLSFLPLPHPSGIAVEPGRDRMVIASTRNPNQLFRLEPVIELAEDARNGLASATVPQRTLVPVESQVLPGSLYLHDLAFIGDDLHGNAVGQNAIVRLDRGRLQERVWWPTCIDSPRGPHFERNYLQLNSIAAGPSLDSSYFSASTDHIGRRRPGHRNFPIDRRGVIFSGSTREPMVRGLTRPHSTRLHGNLLWLDNSGYGEVGFARDGVLEVVARLPGWTRGLCFVDDLAFVGTSRVIPEYRNYAPGLDLDSSLCGVHALDTKTGRVIASLLWPAGNQIFAVEALPAAVSSGLPFEARHRARARERRLFYSFVTPARRPSIGGPSAEDRDAN
jgi:uncharacterized protein (TIGR03032 family)